MSFVPYGQPKGNHSRSHMNQREIDVIKEEVLPSLSYETDEIGVIAPYNKQVDAVKSAPGEDIYGSAKVP